MDVSRLTGAGQTGWKQQLPFLKELGYSQQYFRTLCFKERMSTVKTNDPKYEYYKNGLRKWSNFPLISRISLIISVLGLIMSLLAFFLTA